MVPKVMGDPETENVGSEIFDFFSRIPKIVDFRKKFNFSENLRTPAFQAFLAIKVNGA